MEQNVLASLHPHHPRVMVRAEHFEQLRRLRDEDAEFARLLGRLRQRAEELLEAPVSTHDIPDGKRLLEVSRRVVERVYLLGLLHQIDGDVKWLERLWRELEAVANFPHWNPSHFLDTAEMAHAVAVGYDWCYHALSDEQRCVLREALARHALAPAQAAYDAAEWWTRSLNNWNVVCHGGLASAAVALGQEMPQQCLRVLTQAMQHTPICLEQFAPDGGWAEGPSYWLYTMRYVMVLISCLDAGGLDAQPLVSLPGLAGSALFLTHCTGPTGLIFNYGDAGERSGDKHSQQAALALWSARRFGRDDALFGCELGDAVHPLVALWWHRPAQVPTPPRDARFRGVEVATLRSQWHDPDAWYVAAQCGRNRVGHNQIDLGSFVLDARGQRWVTDPGPDDYNLPGYFGKQRYDYYRNRAEGHNILVLSPDASPGQPPDAGGLITRFDPDPTDPSFEMDLRQAYPLSKRCLRRLTLQGRSALLLEDELECPSPVEVFWFCHTRARVLIAEDGQAATLSLGGGQLALRIESSSPVRLDVMPAQPLPASPKPAGQNPNDGSKLLNAAFGSRVRVGEIPRFGPPDPAKALRKLALHYRAVTDLRLRVTFR